MGGGPTARVRGEPVAPQGPAAEAVFTDGPAAGLPAVLSYRTGGGLARYAATRLDDPSSRKVLAGALTETGVRAAAPGAGTARAPAPPAAAVTYPCGWKPRRAGTPPSPARMHLLFPALVEARCKSSASVDPPPFPPEETRSRRCFTGTTDNPDTVTTKANCPRAERSR